MTNFTNSFERTVDIQNLIAVQNQMPLMKTIYDELLLTGNAFLAFRKNEATVYYKGNNLCTLRDRNKYAPDIFMRFLPLSRSKLLRGNQGKRVTEPEWKASEGTTCSWDSILPEILDNIEKDSSPESRLVSELYKFSPVCNPNGDIVLLDVEVEFEGKSVRTGTKTLVDRIDVLLYHCVEKRLVFIEVKRLSDDRLEPQKGQRPEIIDQLEEYKSVINDPDYISHFNNQYKKVLDYYAKIRNGFPVYEIENPPMLGLLLTEFTRSKKDTERVKEIEKAVSQMGIGVCAIGNTESATESTLGKWYRIIKKYTK